MLGVLVGCILMTITGCKEEQKRDPSFVTKTSSSSSEINLYYTLAGNWVTQRTYSDVKTSTYSEILKFTEDGLCFCYWITNGQRNLIFTADYKYYSGLGKISFTDIIYSQFAITNEYYWVVNAEGNSVLQTTLLCDVTKNRMIISFSNSEVIYIKE
jgi:hypothetical protein